MNSYETYSLKDIAYIDISSVDKKIKENESEVKLCNFTDVYYNWAITKEKYHHFMKATANSNEINRFHLKKGMIAITKDSETRYDIGISTYIADDFEDVILGYHTALIIPDKNKVYPKYLNAYLNTKQVRDYFANQASGSGQRYSLTVKGIENLKVLLPKYEMQKKIGDFISDIDKKIENNNMINHKLEELSKKIYEYWFLQFDFPNKDGKPYKLYNGKMIWNDNLKKEIPEGWKVQNLKENDLTQILNPGIEIFKGSKIYIATGDVQSNNMISGKNITYENRESRANMQPTKDTIWFAKMKNSVKHIFIGEYSKKIIENYIFSTGFLGLKCLNKRNLEYITCFINSDFFEAQKDKLAHGATQEAINNNDTRLIPLVIPDNAVLEKFHKEANCIFQKIYSNSVENEELKSLREYLLPLLMNGQVEL